MNDIESNQLSTMEEVSVQAFIDILNGPNLNTNIVKDLLEFCTNLTPDVDSMSDEIDDYIREVVGHIDGSIINPDHPLVLEYKGAIRKILDTENVIYERFSRYRKISLNINNISGEEIKDIIMEKVK